MSSLLTVAALKLSIRADWLLGVEVGLDLAGLAQSVAVLHLKNVML